MQNFDIFPTLIKSFSYQKHDEVFELAKKYIEDNKSKSYKNTSCDSLDHIACGGSHNSLLYEDQFTDLRNWIIECATKFADDCGYDIKDGFFVTDSWINICSAGGSQKFHNHANSLVSGTYYVNIEPEKHAPIQFKKNSINSSEQTMLYLKKVKQTPYCSDAAIMPLPGELFLWESNISHGYDYNKEDGRISISFNILPKVMWSGIYGFQVGRITSEMNPWSLI